MKERIVYDGAKHAATPWDLRRWKRQNGSDRRNNCYTQTPPKMTTKQITVQTEKLKEKRSSGGSVDFSSDEQPKIRVKIMIDTTSAVAY